MGSLYKYPYPTLFNIPSYWWWVSFSVMLTAAAYFTSTDHHDLLIIAVFMMPMILKFTISICMWFNAYGDEESGEGSITDVLNPICVYVPVHIHFVLTAVVLFVVAFPLRNLMNGISTAEIRAAIIICLSVCIYIITLLIKRRQQLIKDLTMQNELAGISSLPGRSKAYHGLKPKYRPPAPRPAPSPPPPPLRKDP